MVLLTKCGQKALCQFCWGYDTDFCENLLKMIFFHILLGMKLELKKVEGGLVEGGAGRHGPQSHSLTLLKFTIKELQRKYQEKC